MKKKTILITGASSGIGHASARRFQAEGWNVAATMRTPSKGAALAALPGVKVLRLDVTDRDSIYAAVEGCIVHFGGLDVVLNNAGYGLAGAMEAASPAQIERQFATNVYGPIYVMQACLPHFRAQEAGLILNVSSVGGRITYPLNALYHGTKFAMEGISESLAMEVAAFNVRVKLIEPGGVRTDFAGRSMAFAQKEGLDAYDEAGGRVQAAYMAPERDALRSDPEDTADVIFRAATDGADTLRYVAGADAEQLLAMRGQLSDEAFRATILSVFNL
ncbi:MAG: NAD(P)-dependent dehydrogenase (short-subunit alcohol dehydrogenase family) [Myxococcota bacterium]|jgi:NAD(P)-dependent dehydrogenase (short-subunit alcohol dehydrogenase family)